VLNRVTGHDDVRNDEDTSAHFPEPTSMHAGGPVMAAPQWKGALTFGLVSVPVGLYAAVDEHKTAFNQIDRETQRRIRYRKVADGTDTEVPKERIVKGYEVEPGRYILIEPEELDALAPTKSKAIRITDFVDLAEIDPVYFASSFYLGPLEGAERPYALLRDAMLATDRVAVAEFVMRSKQYLAAIRAHEDVLVLSTMHFADEVRTPSRTVPGLSSESFEGRELELAKTLIEQMTVAWEPEQYRDGYHEDVQRLIEAKAAGESIEAPTEEAAAPVLDLMEALQRSMASDAEGGPGADKHKAAAAKKRVGGGAPDHRATREELLERARELGIEGRSTMKRDELAAAVDAAVEAAS
jgi:DNA end-binding protein Ku